jgi:hypothetical protein
VPSAERPDIDDYFTAMEDLAKVVRRALEGKVKRGEIRKALVRYEELRAKARGEPTSD